MSCMQRLFTTALARGASPTVPPLTPVGAVAQASRQHEKELMMQLAVATASSKRGSPLRLSPPRVGLHCGRVRSALPASVAHITIA